MDNPYYIRYKNSLIVANHVASELRYLRTNENYNVKAVEIIQTENSIVRGRIIASKKVEKHQSLTIWYKN